jgi:hypothetical protein
VNVDSALAHDTEALAYDAGALALDADAPVLDADAPVLDADALVLDADALALDADALALDADAPALDADAPALDADAPALDADAPALDADGFAPRRGLERIGLGMFGLVRYAGSVLAPSSRKTPECSVTQEEGANMSSRSRITAIAGACLAVAAVAVFAQREQPPRNSGSRSQADTSAAIVASAQAVLATLDDAGKAKVQFPFDSTQKTRWSNLPSPMFQRNGLRLADLTAPQRAAVMTLLSVALSADGYRKVADIMHGDEVLRQTGGGRGRGPGGAGGGPSFGENQYYLAFVGAPAVGTPWILQFGGHHLAINLTLLGANATMAPSLTGAQPANYSIEGRTVRPLGAENDKGFALVNALNPTERMQAILNYRVPDLVLGPGQDGRTIQPEGIRASALTPAQQNMLWDLVREWTGIMNDAFAAQRMADIRSRLNDTYFAWSGPTTNGSAAYFRVQGPTLVIEYAPQGGVDHIHTIYRDPTNDYGLRFTRQ